MMLLINKSKSQVQKIGYRTKSSTSLYSRKNSTASNCPLLYHSKSQVESTKKTNIKNKNKTIENNKSSKLLSLQVQWKKQLIDKEIEQYTITKELYNLKNVLYEKRVKLELEKKELLIQKNFGIRDEINNSKESLLSIIENEKIDSLDEKINSINMKIEKINHLSNIYDINEAIHNNVMGYISNALRNMTSENIQQLMKLYMKELVELRSIYIFGIFRNNIDSDSLDNLLIELKTAKKPYNLIKYYSKIFYPEKDLNKLSNINENNILDKFDLKEINTNDKNYDKINNNDNISSYNEEKDDIHKMPFQKRELSKNNHFKMEDEYNRMLKSLESLYNVKLREEMEKNNLIPKRSDSYKDTENSRNITKNDKGSFADDTKTDYSLDEYYFNNYKGNISDENSVIYSKMINALQEKLNLEKNTSSNVENNNNESVEIKNLTRQKSLIDKNVPPKPLDENTLNNDNIKSIDNNMKKSSYKHKNTPITISLYSNNNDDSFKGNNEKPKKPLSKSVSYNGYNTIERNNEDQYNKNNILKKNNSDYINKISKSNSKDNYDRNVALLKCSITEKICNDIKKEIRDTYDIDISKKSTPKKLRYNSNNRGIESVKD